MSDPEANEIYKFPEELLKEAADHAGGDDISEHPDERWLVSYADMMTLLFGLFVMLYSMANKFEQVQKSASKEFSKQDVKASPVEPKVEIKQSELDHLRKNLEESMRSAEELKVQALRLSDEVTQRNTELEAAKTQVTELADLNARKTTQMAELADRFNRAQTKAKPDLELQLTEERQNKRKMLVEIEKLRAIVAANPADRQQQKIAQLTEQLNRQTAELQTQKQELQAAQTQNVRVSDLLSQLSTAKAQIAQMEAENNKALAGSFAAVVITWPTQNHDIDLIVTDPEGRVYNYKNRSFDKHPGQFVLDTRRGPGAEMWQTDRLLPGVYQIKYLFYNTYGNSAPAPVSGSVYSQGGIFELPKVDLNFGAKREQVYKITISKKGEVKIVP